MEGAPVGDFGFERVSRGVVVQLDHLGEVQVYYFRHHHCVCEVAVDVPG